MNQYEYHSAPAMAEFEEQYILEIRDRMYVTEPGKVEIFLRPSDLEYIMAECQKMLDLQLLRVRP